LVSCVAGSVLSIALALSAASAGQIGNHKEAALQAQGGVAAAEAIFNEAVKFEKGDGLTIDLPRAAQLFHKACDEGDKAGCADVARLEANSNN